MQIDTTAPYITAIDLWTDKKVGEKLVCPALQEIPGKSIFSLQEKAHFVVLLRNCVVPGHTQLLRRPRDPEAEAPQKTKNWIHPTLVIGVEKSYKIRGKPNKILILWSQLLFLACEVSYSYAIKRKSSHN